MSKVIRVITNKNRESIFFQIKENVYIGFSSPAIESCRNNIVTIIEMALADSTDFLYTPEKEAIERLGGDYIDVTDEFIS